MSALAKRKTYIVDGGTTSTLADSIAVDISNVGKEDIRNMLIAIVSNESANQTRINNPPTITDVDGQKNKPIQQVNKKIVVLFNTQLDVSVLKKVESLLFANISASTNKITGGLSSASNWEWRHIRSGRQVPIVGGKISFRQRDFLVLRPKLSYASAVNKRVASGSRSLTYSPIKKRKSKTVAKRNQNLGFMAMTARQARGMQELVPYSVTAGMTQAFKVAGEARKIGGTAYLLIAPRRKGNYRG